MDVIVIQWFRCLRLRGGAAGSTGEKCDRYITATQSFLEPFPRYWLVETGFPPKLSMPRAGYQPLSQTGDDDDVADLEAQSSNPPPTRGLRRAGRPGHIDLTKLDNAFKRWTESIAQKVKRKKKVTNQHARKPIHRSVFEPAIPASSTAKPLVIKTLDHNPPMTQAEFDALVQSVKSAIAEGIHPKMITKGSSGSYFARAKDEDGRVRTVAVFKPKDEEPYGRLNPKTTKWIHRQFRWIIPFGRACLIPNLSYISEAAASLLDERLGLHIVPPTRLVSLSSPAFFYDWLDRSAAKKGKPLPEKIGSMQFFLHGYTDASDFLRKHPWPGRSIADTFDDSTHRQGGFSKRFLSAIKVVCGRTGDTDDLYDDYEDERLFDATEANNGSGMFYWSPALQQSFREELEKLVILGKNLRPRHYLMLNTDRGADNYMIKYCEGETEKHLIDVAPTRSMRGEMPQMSELRRAESSSSAAQGNAQPSMTPSASYSTSCPETGDYRHKPHIHIAAIDNSLSFPHEHPQGWRSYTYGWLYLPVNLVGRPFSEKTRNHFLPILTSKAWWEETTYQLQKLFAIDPDFNLKMFRRQLAVIKGQAWNIVQSLKHADEGPLELTRRTKALVWDDEIEIDVADLDDANTEDPLSPQPEVGPASPKLSISSVPVSRPRPRRQSSGGDFPPPMRRTSTDARPVPFATKFQKIHPGTTGVTMLEHLERLDAVEAKLQRLTIQEEADEMEVDVGEARSAPIKAVVESVLTETASETPGPSSVQAAPTSPFSPPGSPTLDPVQEDDADSVTEEDLVALSKSTSHVEGPSRHTRWASEMSRRGMEWLPEEQDTPTLQPVIVESRPHFASENQKLIEMAYRAVEEVSTGSDSDYSSSVGILIHVFDALKEQELDIDEDFILDRFNLTGLNNEVANYPQALDLITDQLGWKVVWLENISQTDAGIDDEVQDELRGSLDVQARLLYGLIHARWIVTARGLSKMVEKYKRAEFGRCPRVLCHSQPLLPVGLTDIPYEKSVKLYCGRCEDIYSPKSSRHGSIDGAYFGTTFPHLLFLVYPTLIPSKSGVSDIVSGNASSSDKGIEGRTRRRGVKEDMQEIPVEGGGETISTASVALKAERYRPKIYGFQVNEIAKLQRWQEAVRDRQVARLEELEEQS
ncbi:Phosphatidylinositol 4-kinase LSB6 [Paramarasmius palmivorus]|uniref:1-phosphatidylinositol 4-kinase n=1 Tax=Paramarasmius palmivorus TaxID=297713 RepID=A0AAW0D403_9AGAR